MSSFNLSAGYGQVVAMQIASAVGPNLGQILVVCEDSDVAQMQNMLTELFPADNEGRVRFFRTLEAAYDAAVTNANDVILLTAHSTHSLTAGIAWSKSRIHVIGMDGGDRLVQQGAKVQSSSTDDTGYVLKVTGVRNSFRNIKFIQASTDAAALTVVQMGGEGNLYKNCSFVFGVATRLGGTSTYEVVNGEDSGTFIDCTFGSDTLLTSAARAVMLVDQVTSGQEFKSNIFRGCTFLISSSSSTAAFIRLAAVTDILFTNLFDRCNMIASVDTAGGAAIAEAVQTGTGTNKGTLNFAYPAVFNVTNFSTATSGRNAGIQVVGVSVAPNAGVDYVGVIPIAT